MLLYPYKIKRSSQIVVPIVDTGVAGYQVSFPDQPYLRGRKIVGLSCGTIWQLDNGNENIFRVSTNLFDYPVFITLTNSSNTQFIQNMPAVELNSTYHQNTQGLLTDNIPVNLNGIILWEPTEVVWPKSYLWFPAGVNGANPNVSAVFTVYYQ